MGINTVQAAANGRGFDMTGIRYGSLVLLSALGLVATPCFAAKISAILGKHVKDCAAYNATSIDYEERTLQTSYIVGYLSAAATYTEGDLLSGTDTSKILDWFNKYCSAHPEDGIFRALDHYVETEGGRK
jgi:hypothetical protein